MTEKDVGFRWQDAEKQAFDKVKELVSSEPMLAMLDPSKSYEVETDVLDFVVGG